MAPEYETWEFPAEGIDDTRELTCERVQVLRAEGPGILILHELPGMTPECLQLAEDLHAEGFSVYLPVLFGEPGEEISSARRSWCIWREWSRLARGEESPVATWVRELARRVHDKCGGPGSG